FLSVLLRPAAALGEVGAGVVLRVGWGGAAVWPFFSPVCFAGPAAAVGFCSGWFPGVVGGKSGWCDVAPPIGLGGRGGITSPNMGENTGSVDAAPEPSATRLITKITRIFTEASPTHALNGPFTIGLD